MRAAGDYVRAFLREAQAELLADPRLAPVIRTTLSFRRIGTLVECINIGMRDWSTRPGAFETALPPGRLELQPMMNQYRTHAATMSPNTARYSRTVRRKSSHDHCCFFFSRETIGQWPHVPSPLPGDIHPLQGGTSLSRGSHPHAAALSRSHRLHSPGGRSTSTGCSEDLEHARLVGSPRKMKQQLLATKTFIVRQKGHHLDQRFASSFSDRRSGMISATSCCAARCEFTLAEFRDYWMNVRARDCEDDSGLKHCRICPRWLTPFT